MLSFFISALPKTFVDVIFASGGYGANAYRLFDREKEIIQAIVNQQGTAVARYGLIQYRETSAVIQRKLSQFTNNADFKRYVRFSTLGYRGRGLVPAMTQASNEFKSSSAKRKVLVLFGNGVPAIPFQDLSAAAKKLADEGVKLIVVFFGNNVDRKRLERIVPSIDDIFRGNSWTKSDILGNKIALQLFKGM